MCSGCYGEYSGDYYYDVEYTANNEADLPGEVASRGNDDASREDDANAVPPHSVSNNLCEMADSAVGIPPGEYDWQVFVSADQIIEMHFLRARFHDAMAAAVEYPAPGGQSDGNAGHGQRSGRSSANNYQTLSGHGFFEASGYRIRLVQIGLGAVTAAIFAAWSILR